MYPSADVDVLNFYISQVNTYSTVSASSKLVNIDHFKLLIMNKLKEFLLE